MLVLHFLIIQLNLLSSAIISQPQNRVKAVIGMEPELDKQQKIYEVIVRVSDPQLQQSGGYNTYLISGQDQHGTFEIRRRYNDFFYLRQALKKKWPGLYIPPIPQKKITFVPVSKDSEIVEIRRKFFDIFFARLSKKHHLFYCGVTQQFLRNKTLNIEKYYTTISNPIAKELADEYKKIFAKEIVNANQVELRNITNNFFAYLKKAQKELKNMKSQVSVVAEARKQFFENLNKCNNTILPGYQKDVYSHYVSEEKAQGGLLFIHNHKVQDNIRNLRDYSVSAVNPFQLCLDMITYEAMQIQAMQEAIIGRETCEKNKKNLQEKYLTNQAEVAKLTGGKTTFKSLFSRGDKKQQIEALQKSIPQLQKEIEGMSELCEIINIVLGSVQISCFKKDKQVQYYKMMETVSAKQLEYLAAYGQFMKSLMDGLNK